MGAIYGTVNTTSGLAISSNGLCMPGKITVSKNYLKDCCGSDGEKITIADDNKEYECRLTPPVQNVIFNDPATIVYFEDGTKTVVKRMEGQKFDPDYGFMACLVKKAYGEDYHKLMWKYCWGGQEARRKHRKESKVAWEAKDEKDGVNI